MGFGTHIKDAFGAVTFDTAAIRRLAKDKTSFGYGILFLVIAGIASGMSILSPLWMVISPLVTIISWFIATAIMHGIAKAFGGKGTYAELFGVLAHTSILHWSMVIPFIGLLFGVIANIWALVAAVPIIEHVHKLSRSQAVGVVLIPVGVLVTIGFILFYILLITGLVLSGFMLAQQAAMNATA